MNSRYRFENTCAAKRLVDTIVTNKNFSKIVTDLVGKDVYKTETDFDVDPTKPIDFNVYKTNPQSYQKMRCVFSTKSKNDNRQLVPINSGTGNLLDRDQINITDYLIGHNDDDIVFLKSVRPTDTINTTPKVKTKVGSKKSTTKKSTTDIVVKGPIINTVDDSSPAEKQQMLNMIRSSIKSARFVGSSVRYNDDGSCITFHAFDYDHTNECICGHIHDRINGYVYKKGVNVYAGCYSKTCTETVKIGTLNYFIENWNDQQNVKKFSAKFIPKNKILTKIKQFMVDDDESKILALKSAMGTGKTQSVETMLNGFFDKHGKDSRVITFSLRQAYANDVSHNAYKNLNFTNYLDAIRDEIDLTSVNRLIMSLESFHKLYDDRIKMYDVVILDECESTLVQFFSATVKSNRECFDGFVDLLKYAKKIICLDADLSINRSIKFLKTIAPVRIFRNTYKPPKRTYEFVNDYNRYSDQIIEDIKANNSVCIVSIDRAHGMHIRDSLWAAFPKMKDNNEIVFIHGDCDRRLKNELTNVNTNWTNYRVLIYNTVIGQGVDYNIIDHFKKVYAIVVGGICTQREFFQMIGRIRNPIETDVTCLVGKHTNIRTDSFVYDTNYACNYCRSMLEIPVDKMKMIYRDKQGDTYRHSEQIESAWNSIRASYILEKSNSDNSNFMTVMKLMIEARGDIYKEDHTTEKTEIDIKTCLDRVIEVKTPNEEEYAMLNQKDRSDVTEHDQLSMKKYQLARNQNFLNDTPEEIVNNWIRIYSENETIIDNIRALRNKHIDIGQLDDDDDNEGTKGCKKKKIREQTEDELILAQRYHLRSCYEKTLASLGCHGWCDNTIVIDAKKFNVAIRKLDYAQDEIRSLGLKGIKYPNKRILRNVLSKHGISLETYSEQDDKKEDRPSVNVGFELRRDIDIYTAVHNSVSCDLNNNQIDKRFVKIVKQYDQCKKYRVPPKTKSNVTNKKSLFVGKR